ncbi:MAG: short-chain dehydrogenase [Acidobacteria bacterium]|nr:MAG: short-chain dehydrogenase [Acidobacteriota bacterium]
MKNRMLITGANRGIGLEFVKQYLDRGWEVIATCREPSQAKELLELESQTGFLQIKKLDVTNEEDYLMLPSWLDDQSLDVVIANAGVYGGKTKTVHDLAVKTWLDVFHVNTIAPFLLARYTEQALKKSVNGKLIVITSKMGSIDDNGSGGSYIYRSSKAALNAAGRSLAIDWNNLGIAVGIFHPGWVQTDMGGPNALITVHESVSNLIEQIDHLSLANAGRFLNYDGKVIPW